MLPHGRQGLPRLLQMVAFGPQYVGLSGHAAALLRKMGEGASLSEDRNSFADELPVDLREGRGVDGARGRRVVDQRLPDLDLPVVDDRGGGDVREAAAARLPVVV